MGLFSALDATRFWVEPITPPFEIFGCGDKVPNVDAQFADLFRGTVRVEVVIDGATLLQQQIGGGELRRDNLFFVAQVAPIAHCTMGASRARYEFTVHFSISTASKSQGRGCRRLPRIRVCTLCANGSARVLFLHRIDIVSRVFARG